MARKLYRARDKLVRKLVRGALVEENVRTRKQRKVGRTEEEQEILRTHREDIEEQDDDLRSARSQFSRLHTKRTDSEDDAVLPNRVSRKSRLRHSAEEIRGEARRPQDNERDRALFHEEETDPPQGDDLQQEEMREKHASARDRQGLKKGERYRDHDARERTAKDSDLAEGSAYLTSSIQEHTQEEPETQPIRTYQFTRSRRRGTQDHSALEKKKRQRKQAEVFRGREEAEAAAVETFEELAAAETNRVEDLSGYQRSHRLNHSDEGTGMVQGAGHLARTALVATTAPIAAEARRQMREAGEENSAVHSADTGVETMRRVMRHQARYHTGNRSRREENLRLPRTKDDITAALAGYGSHAAQTEHRKKERIQAFQKKKRQMAAAQAKRKESAIVSAGGFVDNANSMFKAPKKAREAAKPFFSEHKGAIIGVCVAGLIFSLFALALSSGASLVQGSGTTVISTTYVSSDKDIYDAENACCALEAGLNRQINALTLSHPGYDDYEFQVDEIEHNPYSLISYLQAKYGSFTYTNEIKGEISRLFRQQYRLALSETSEIRTRMEMVTQLLPVYDPEIRDYRWEEVEVEQEVEYEHRTLYAALTNRGFDQIARSNLTDDQLILYNALNATYGNRPYLFDLNTLSGAGGSGGTQYEIPPEALSDEKFANIIREAEKYLGMPYVWGGKSPRTGFDCSGFVCWVLNHCGNGWDVGRKRAKELCNMCIYVSPEEARPGDLIFFEKTYDTTGASHVGIYVGNHMMVHCGNVRPAGQK